MNNTIVISGGAGLAGSYMAKNLLAKGYKVKILIRPGTDTSLLPPVSEQLSFTFAPLDDIPALEQAICDDVSHLIHAAAMVSFWPKTKELMYKTNIEGTANLVNICLQRPNIRFCHISSIAVLGKKIVLGPIDEALQPEQNTLESAYGKSKFLAENEVWRGIAEGLSAVIINPSVILGAGNISQGSSALFGYAIGGHRYYSPGLLNYIDARDLAEITARLLFSDITDQRFIVNGGTTTYKNFFELTAAKFGTKAPSTPITKSIAGLAWRLAAIKAFFDQKAPLITKETAHSAFSQARYSSAKLLETLPIEFSSLEDTIAHVYENIKTRI